MPFTFVNSHLVVSGQIGGQRVHFVMDTGAPRSTLDVPAAKRVGLRFDNTDKNDGRGLDGGSAAIYKGGLATLLLADRSIPDAAFEVAALPVFKRMAVHKQNVGLLDLAFFARFARVELHFAKRVVRFVER